MKDITVNLQIFFSILLFMIMLLKVIIGISFFKTKNKIDDYFLTTFISLFMSSAIMMIFPYLQKVKNKKLVRIKKIINLTTIVLYAIIIILAILIYINIQAIRNR